MRKFLTRTSRSRNACSTLTMSEKFCRQNSTCHKSIELTGPRSAPATPIGLRHPHVHPRRRTQDRMPGAFPVTSRSVTGCKTPKSRMRPIASIVGTAPSATPPPGSRACRQGACLRLRQLARYRRVVRKQSVACDHVSGTRRSEDRLLPCQTVGVTGFSRHQVPRGC